MKKYNLSLVLFAALLLAACRHEGVNFTEVVQQQAGEDNTVATATSPTIKETTDSEEGLGSIESALIDGTETTARDPVTLELYTADIATLDPQAGEDVVALNNIESLFVNLTNYELGSNEVVPEAASDWTISEDGLIYTFNIRPDIPWVQHDPVSGETSQALDEAGKPRFVTAHDFEFSIKRACHPNSPSYFSTVIAPTIEGCENALNLSNPEDEESVMAALDAIGVTALDESKLEIRLTFPASYFLSMTPMWIMAASPQWAIEQYGNNKWLEPGQIVTNGRYVLHEWIPDVRRTVSRNPLMPADMAGTGNIDQIVTTVVPDTTTGYFMWLNNEVDVSAIPDDELMAHLEQFAGEIAHISDLVVFYFSFRETKEPFDDPRVRRAFSAAFDRESFVASVRQGQGQPMIHFAPPGIFGAPPIDLVGVGFDPEFARSQLAAAGYPDCQGFPPITILGYSGTDILDWIEFAKNQWEKNLGCGSELLKIEQLPFADVLAATEASVPDVEAPHIFTLGWGPDYPDENNWVGDVLWCGKPDSRQKRECGEMDDLIVAARSETDPNRRIEMYHAIEEMFFGPEGEYPIMPVWVRIAFSAQHDWLVEAPRALFGGQQYYNWTIDQDAKLEARGQ